MKRMLMILLACGAMSGAVFAGVGTIDAGADALEIAEKIHNVGWNEGGPACRVNRDNPNAIILEVTADCEARKPKRKVDHTIKVITPTEKLENDFCYSIEVQCDASGRLETWVDFEILPPGADPAVVCNMPQHCPTDTAPNNYQCEFLFPTPPPQGKGLEGFEISVSTNEYAVTTIPSLGTMGMIAMTIGLLGVGVFVLLRRGIA